MPVVLPAMEPPEANDLKSEFLFDLPTLLDAAAAAAALDELVEEVFSLLEARFGIFFPFTLVVTLPSSEFRPCLSLLFEEALPSISRKCGS